MLDDRKVYVFPHVYEGNILKLNRQYVLVPNYFTQSRIFEELIDFPEELPLIKSHKIYKFNSQREVNELIIDELLPFIGEKAIILLQKDVYPFLKEFGDIQPRTKIKMTIKRKSVNGHPKAT